MPVKTDLNLDTLSDAELKAYKEELLAEYKARGTAYAEQYAQAVQWAGSHQAIPTTTRRALNAIAVEQFAVNAEREIVDTVLNRSGFVGGIGGIPTTPIDPSTGQPTGPDSAGNPPLTPVVPPTEPEVTPRGFMSGAKGAKKK